MRVPIPAKDASPLRADPGFDAKWKDILVSLGAQSVYLHDDRADRMDYAIFEIADLSTMFELARKVHAWLGVKSEFMPEMAPESHSGRK